MHIVEQHDFKVMPRKTAFSHVWHCEKEDICIQVKVLMAPPSAPVLVNVFVCSPGGTIQDAFQWFEPVCKEIPHFWEGITERLIYHDVVCKPLVPYQEPTLGLPDLDS